MSGHILVDPRTGAVTHRRECDECGGEGEVDDADCDCAECRAASGGDAHEDAGETRDDNSAALAVGGAA